MFGDTVNAEFVYLSTWRVTARSREVLGFPREVFPSNRVFLCVFPEVSRDALVVSRSWKLASPSLFIDYQSAVSQGLPAHVALVEGGTGVVGGGRRVFTWGMSTSRETSEVETVGTTDGVGVRVQSRAHWRCTFSRAA